MNLKTCFQPQISPDGQWIAYLLRQAGNVTISPMVLIFWSGKAWSMPVGP
jgi:hypothetical protein